MRIQFTLLFFTGLLAGCASSKHAPKPEMIFNGKSLDGWVIEHGGVWEARDGVLTGRNGQGWSTNANVGGSWLRTKRMYQDFILDLEYNINEKGNSGVFLRSTIEENPAFTGDEIQILADAGQPPSPSSTGAVYALVAPTKNPAKPAGEWNRMRIEARGHNVNVWLNGEEIVNWVPLRAYRGYVGLQNHDSQAVVRFRNVQLTNLTPELPWFWLL